MCRCFSGESGKKRTLTNLMLQNSQRMHAYHQFQGQNLVKDELPVGVAVVARKGFVKGNLSCDHDLLWKILLSHSLLLNCCCCRCSAFCPNFPPLGKQREKHTQFIIDSIENAVWSFSVSAIMPIWIPIHTGIRGGGSH